MACCFRKTKCPYCRLFAGSGTTLHTVNLLNVEDNGNRRCILVTNNEVSEAESKALREQGYQPGDPEWENMVYVAQLLGLELNIAYLENAMTVQFYLENISQTR